MLKKLSLRADEFTFRQAAKLCLTRARHRRAQLILLSALLLITSLLTPDSVNAYQVLELPSDNLVTNPWFRSAADPGQASLEGWSKVPIPSGSEGWGLSQKDSNPTPDLYTGTAARISTGRGDGETGQNVEIGEDAYIYQVVTADPSLRRLWFDMHWVTHTLNPGQVNIYGSNSPEGAWTHLWQPFYQVVTKMVKPPGGEGQDWLWHYYSDSTDLVYTDLAQGYPYYKIEFHGNLPDRKGGFKFTGVYFAAKGIENQSPVAYSGSITTASGEATPITLNFQDLDGPGPYTLTITTPPHNGSLTTENEAYVYTPESGYTGEDSLEWMVNDGLSDSNIATVSIQVISSPGPDLVGEWKLDDGVFGDGQMILDSSMSGWHGETIDPDSTLDCTRQGISSTGCYFDGVNNNISINNIVPPVQGTIAFWILAENVANQPTLFTADSKYRIDLDSGGHLVSAIFARTRTPLTTMTALNANQWYHVSVTYDLSTHEHKIYINGVEEASDLSATSDPGAPLTLTLGSGLQGMLDEVQIYDRVLNGSEVHSLYNSYESQ